MDDEIKDWKLKLRYGRLTTNFKHFTVLADGEVGELIEGFDCRPGRAWMSMKVWAADADEAVDLIDLVGKDVGFTVDGRTHVYTTEPTEPPRERPCAYDIKFSSYNRDEESDPI